MVWSLLLLAAAVFVAFGYFSSGVIIDVPRLPLDADPKAFGCDFEDFTVRTADGVRLEGWFVPSRWPSSATVLALHGWGANRSDILPTVIPLAERFNLVLFDFRNHGKSGGNATSLTCLEVRDLEAVVRSLRERRPDQTKAIGVVGFSMGGAVAITGAAGLPEVRAVVAESPFSSFNDIVRHFSRTVYHLPRFTVPVTLWFARKRLGFDPEECSPLRHVARIAPRPLLLIQGDSDPRMLVSEGQALYNAAGEPKELWTVKGAEHIGARAVSEKEYDERVMEFFRKWLKA